MLTTEHCETKVEAKRIIKMSRIPDNQLKYTIKPTWDGFQSSVSKELGTEGNNMTSPTRVLFKE